MRRRPPSATDVEDVLRPIELAARRMARAQLDRDDLILEASLSTPRPTNKQIGERAGITEAAVRYVLREARARTGEPER